MLDRSNPVKERKIVLFSTAVALMLGAVTAQSANVVPWLNRPAAERATAQLAAASRPCAASDLKVTLGGAGAFRGNATQEILITNAGTDRCFLLGAPGLQLHPAGKPAQSVDLSTRPSDRIDLSPGELTIVLIGTPGSCDAANKPGRNPITRLSVTPLGGGSITLDGAYVDTLCGPASLVKVQHVHPERPASVGSLNQLSGSLSAPQVAARGDTLHYTVTLTNPTGRSIALSPCPSYSQSLDSEGASTSQTLLLNCDAAGGQIPAKSSVTFEMQTPVSANFAGRGVKLSWTLGGELTVGTIIPLQ